MADETPEKTPSGGVRAEIWLAPEGVPGELVFVGVPGAEGARAEASGALGAAGDVGLLGDFVGAVVRPTQLEPLLGTEGNAGTAADAKAPRRDFGDNGGVTPSACLGLLRYRHSAFSRSGFALLQPYVCESVR